MKKVLLKILKGIGIFLAVIVGLVAIIILAIRTPQVQNFLTDKAESWFRDNTGAKLDVGHIYLNWANELEIQDAYLEDNNGDTLAYIGNLSTSLSLMALTKNNLDLTAVELQNTTIRLRQSGKDQTFNFQFILDSLASGQPAADTVTKDTTAGKPWEIIVEEIDLQNIDFSLVNTYAKTDLEVKLQKVNTRIDNLGLDSMNFKLSSFDITGADVYYADESEPAPPQPASDTTEAVPFSIEISSVSITESEVDFLSKEVIYDGEITDFTASEVSFDLLEETIRANKLTLENSENIVELFPIDPAIPPAEPAVLPFDIKVKTVSISDNRFSLRNQQPPTPEFNPEQLRLTEINAEITDIHLNATTYKADIKQITLTESEKIEITSFSTMFEYQDSIININDLNLTTNHSELAANAMYDLKSDYSGNDRFRIRNLDGTIAREDIAYFYPPIDTFPIRDKITFAGKARGDFDEVTVQSFTLKNGETYVETTGKITNLISENIPIGFDIPKLELTSTARQIRSFLPDTLLPDSLTIPDDIKLTANAAGNLNDVKGKINLLTSLGSVKTDINYQADPETGAVAFDFTPNVDSVQLGRILGMNVLGSLTMSGNISGQGPSFAESSIDIDAVVNSFTYNDFKYQKINIDGVVKGASFEGKVISEMEELDFKYEGLVNVNDSLNALDFRLNVQNLDLQALNFVDFPMEIKTVVSADIDFNKENRLNGDISIRKVEIDRADAVYYIDSLVFISIDNDERTDLTLDSDLFNGYLKGNMPLKHIPEEINEHLDRYFRADSARSNVDILDKNFEFYLNIKRPELISQAFVPGLEKLQISPLEITFNGQKEKLDMNFVVNKLVYNGILLDSLKLDLIADKKTMEATTRLGRLQTGDVVMTGLTLTGESRTNGLNLLLDIPKNDTTEFRIAAQILKENNYFTASVFRDSVLFRGNRWTVPRDNLITFDQGMWIENLSFENGARKLSIYSEVQDQDTVQVMDFNKFRLENLTSAFSESESLVGGVVDGHFEYDQTNATFNSETEIKNLTYTDKLLGNLMLEATNANDRIQLDGILSQEAGQAEIKGVIDPSNPDNTAIDLTVDDLKIKNFTAFADEVVSELEGSLNGKVTITGDLIDPQMNGFISTNDVMIKPTALNTGFYINDEKITFNERKISMNGFTILDANKNKASLDGSVRLKEFLVDNINLTFNTDKFLVINSTEEQNDLMHAKAWVDTDVKITGDQNLLKVNADIKLLENSDIIYTVPPLANSIARGEGVVRWIDQDEQKAVKVKEKGEGAKVEKTETELSGFDIRLKIEVNDESKLTVIVDPQSGDKLEARGNANLIFSMNPLGDMSMTGRYTVSQGSYKLNFYGLAKREFQIVEGGTVTWTGDVMEAQVDITARYITDAIPPFSAINRKIPFYVNLNINGEILTPTLDFNISMPPELRSQYGNVYTYLQDINNQETELNKQVFSLVLFNSFIADNNDTSTPLLNNTARNSLSKIFSSQLNRLTGGIDAVDISLGLESYEFTSDGTTNSRTDLSLDLSKSLLDDKLVIKVSSNINLEGEEASSDQNISSFIGDVVLEYKLTEDGRYRIKAFRVEEYDDLAQGEIAKTGVGFVILKDFDTLDELFSKAESKTEETEEN